MPLRHYYICFIVCLLTLCCDSKTDTVKTTVPSPPVAVADNTTSAPAATTAPSQGEPLHSQGDIVRASRTSGTVKFATLPVVSPQWDAPQSLTFRMIRAAYDDFQAHGQLFSETFSRMNGAAVVLSGAVMPLEKPPADGKLSRFWLASPKVVMAGCVFCNPPTLGDLVYVATEDKPLAVDREELYRGVVVERLLGRFFIERQKSIEGAEYLFRMEMKQTVE